MKGTAHTLWLKEPVTGGRSDNNRRHGRVKCQDVGCTLGAVEDLSASGLRIRTRGAVPRIRAGDTFTITIHTLHGPMLAPVRVTWIKRIAWRTHELGVAFREVGPALSKALASLAGAAAHNETILPWYKSIA